MNVFDWRGPPFLLFFAVFGVALVLLLRQLREAIEAPDVGDPARSHDPYLIACLRGGVDEAIRVTVVSLVDRQLLVVDGDSLCSAAQALSHVRRPIEREILTICARSTKLRDVVRAESVRAQAELLDQELAAQGFRALPRVQTGRLALYLVFAAVSGYVALHKIALALQRGHSNIAFLVILLLIFLIAFAQAAFPRRTRAGDQHLAALKQLFKSGYETREALRPGGGSTELVWLCAVYGVSTLTPNSFPARDLLFPQAQKRSSDSASSSCGGSSCSGGGCGGGCSGGGCGGCGGGD